jgi:pentatricopeptide repeat domain-containing protein 1
MKDRGVTPTSYACELVIGGLAKKLLWRRGLQVLELMTELNIPKTVITYNTIISACARAQEVGMAKSLLARMQKEGIRPDEVSFNSVIGACASTARWKDALSLLDQCYREPGVTPNIYIYTNAMR